MYISSSIKCPFCLVYLDRDPSWRPPPGYDPLMRKFICPFCENDIYIASGHIVKVQPPSQERLPAMQAEQ